MKRREMMSLIAGAAAWPLAARAQERRRVPKVGVLWHAADADGEWPYYGSLHDGFEELGYSSARSSSLIVFPTRSRRRFKAWRPSWSRSRLMC